MLCCVVLCYVMLCCVVWCGVVLCGVVWCGVVLYHLSSVVGGDNFWSAMVLMPTSFLMSLLVLSEIFIMDPVYRVSNPLFPLINNIYPLINNIILFFIFFSTLIIHIHSLIIYILPLWMIYTIPRTIVHRCLYLPTFCSLPHNTHPYSTTRLPFPTN